MSPISTENITWGGSWVCLASTREASEGQARGKTGSSKVGWLLTWAKRTELMCPVLQGIQGEDNAGVTCCFIILEFLKEEAGKSLHHYRCCCLVFPACHRCLKFFDRPLGLITCTHTWMGISHNNIYKLIISWALRAVVSVWGCVLQHSPLVMKIWWWNSLKCPSGFLL